MKRSLLFLLAIVFSPLWLTGCTTVLYQCYDGEPLPADQVVWLKSFKGKIEDMGDGWRGGRANLPMYVYLDDKYLNQKFLREAFGGGIYELLPGKHTFSTAVSPNDCTRYGEWSFEGEAGHTYAFIQRKAFAGRSADRQHIYQVINSYAQDVTETDTSFDRSRCSDRYLCNRLCDGVQDISERPTAPPGNRHTRVSASD